MDFFEAVQTLMRVVGGGMFDRKRAANTTYEARPLEQGILGDIF